MLESVRRGEREEENARRENDAGGGDGAEELLDGDALVRLERGARDGDEGVDGERLGRFGEPVWVQLQLQFDAAYSTSTWLGQLDRRDEEDEERGRTGSSPK